MYGVIAPEELKLNKNELASRLRVPKDLDVTFSDECEKLVFEVLNPRYCYVKVPVKILLPNKVDLEFAVLESKNLCTSLTGCESAYITAVTLGIGVDRLISKLAITSPAKSFIADGIASAFAEAAADKLSDILGEGETLKPRFSPGYGDLSLSYQRPVLEFLSAEKTVGITLNESLLMTPSKSITAIQGILKQQ